MAKKKSSKDRILVELPDGTRCWLTEKQYDKLSKEVDGNTFDSEGLDKLFGILEKMLPMLITMSMVKGMVELFGGMLK